MPAISETHKATQFPRGIARELTPLSMWGGDTLIYRSIIALALVSLPLVGLSSWLANGTPWGPQVTIAAVLLAGGVLCYTLSRRGMRDTAAALMIGIIWLSATIFALGTEFGIHSAVIYLYLPCLLFGVLFFGVTFASIELVLTVAALLFMYWAEERGMIGGLSAFAERSSNLNFLVGIVATCVGTLVGGVVYHRRVESEAARVVAGAEQLRQSVEHAQLAQAERETAHAKLRQVNEELSARDKSRDHELARARRDIDMFYDVVSKEFPASLHALRAAIARPDDGTEARLQREIGHMEEIIGALVDLGRHGVPALQRARVDLSALAQDEARRLHAVRELAGVRFDIAAGLHAAADPRSVASLLRHLVKRAAGACRAEAEPLVQFGSGTYGGRAVFFVRDSGPGMDLARREKLFRPFERDGTHDGPQDDTVDIGIVSARRIVERHGGEFSIESRPGEGTTIYFSLPAPA